MGFPATPTEGPRNTQNWFYLSSLFLTGKGSPEKVVRARIGALYLREDGGEGTTLYVKEKGNGTNEGWKAK